MRVLHMGNVANNGFINAKLLRRAGVEADALVDEWHILSQPEWEDAPLDGAFDAYAQLSVAAAQNGWTIPKWVLARPVWDPEYANQPWLRERVRTASGLPEIRRTYRRLSAAYTGVAELQGTGPLRLRDVAYAWVWVKRLEQSFGPLPRLFTQYDLLQAYAIHPILPLMTDFPRPYVAFEHGTMRDVPFEDTWYGRLLALAYRQAAKIIITNPDVTAQAARLQVRNYVFVPHPIDETKYTPGPSELRRHLVQAGFDFVAVCPSRHDWDIKGTDLMLRAFAQLVQADRPNAVLVLSEWGLDLDRSKSLIHELGVERNVRWVSPLPKLRLIDAYRAADVVLDQFLIGTFGAVAPEAMACGRPVVMAYDVAHHDWCYPVQPPVVDARSREAIYRELSRLAADEGERERIGQAGRAWVEEHHSSQVVVDRHLAVYEEVLGRGKEAEAVRR